MFRYSVCQRLAGTCLGGRQRAVVETGDSSHVLSVKTVHVNGGKAPRWSPDSVVTLYHIR